MKVHVMYLTRIILCILVTLLVIMLGLTPTTQDATASTRHGYAHTYVPKAQRWKRLRAIKVLLIAMLTQWGQRWTPWETTWHEYKARCARRRWHQHAIKVATLLREEQPTTDSKTQWWCRPPPWHGSRQLHVEQVLSDTRTNSEGERIRVNVTHFDTDAESRSIGIDNRCSACISHDINDFDGPLRKVNRVIKGFGGQNTYEVYQGTIVWHWYDNQGQIHKFRIPNSYYVPKGHVRLLSPQHWARTQLGSKIKHARGTGETTTATKSTLFWNNGANQLDVMISERDNCATFYLAPGFNNFAMFCQECRIDYNESMQSPIHACDTQVVSDDEDDDIDVTESPNRTTVRRKPTLWSRLTGLPFGRRRAQEEARDDTETPTTTNFNLNGPTRSDTKPPVVIEEEEDRQPTTAASELLRYHHRFGHVSFAKLQNMAKQNIIPRRLAECQVPACSACLFAKATRRQWRSKRRRDWTSTNNATAPGQVVSVDQLVSPTPGLIAQMTGKLTTKRYRYATVYVDQYSGLSYVYLQKTADADETIAGKKAFEAYASQFGVKVSAYHADNGIFRANKWVDECRANRQTLTFAGVNAHHSNGLAERRIRSLQDLTRSQLIHMDRRWRMQSTVNLWPYALRMSCEAINETPNLKRKDGLSPMQLFSGSSVQTNTKHWMPFGCPVYVLENALQTGRGIHHKWEYRSKVGIYLGRSPYHGRNVALVLDRMTGLVSPQFHVAFDPSFRTVREDEFHTTWQRKAGFLATKKTAPSAKKKRPSSESIFRRNEELQEPEGALAKETSTTARPAKRRKTSDPASEAEVPATNEEAGNTRVHANDSHLATQEDSTRPDQSGRQRERTTTHTERNATSDDGQPADESRADGTQQTPPTQIIEAMMAELSKATAGDIQGEIFVLQAMFPNYAGLPELDPLQVFKATADPDTMYHHQAMKEPDAEQFKKAMQKEWDDQLQNGNFTVVHRSEVREGVPVLPAVWQMKRKRDIRTRQIKKYKARLNIDGSRMKYGQHYDQTYAPVASWNSIRTLLILSALHNWHTRQIDYVLAFPQAPVEREIYMEIPRGFSIREGNTKDYVLRLHRNVYGQKQSSRVWYKYLSDILINKVGFKRSEVDECVFYRGNVMYVLYTDDSILAGPDLDEVNKAIEDIKRAKLNITIEGDIQDFLGVNIDRKPDGSIHLTQPHLIDQIIQDLKMPENTGSRTTPAASSKLLSRHSKSDDFDNSFNYRSVIGKLNYLEKGSRPDIAYITHQCARFSTCPKKEHGEAIRWVARYLKGTRDKGMILKPTAERGLEVFVDADFAGNWDQDETDDRDTARSRHGYLIMYAGCPILWKSQLQTEVALSSTESEYTGISYALRDAIPIISLFKEMLSEGIPIDATAARVHCRVFEDNTGALEIAKVAKFRPRTKHLNCRLHHFRSYVDNGEISIHKIDTLEQPADLLTKPLNEDAVAKFRKMIMGW